MSDSDLIELGWREWLALPDLGIPAIKAKIDTGARSSALHAASVSTFECGGAEWARFTLHPVRGRRDILVTTQAPVLDRRVVSDSGGNREQRIFIRTRVRAGDETWPIELNLTDRESMLFPMLLGRTAMKGRVHVLPDQSYRLGKPSEDLLREYPQQAQDKAGRSA